METITFQNVSKRHGKLTILSNVSFKIPRGHTWALVGPSGVGKSTLLHLVAGLEKPNEGRISIFGSSPAVSARKRIFGYVFQDDLLLPWLTVSRNIGLPLDLAGHQRDETDRLVHQHCKHVNLDKLGHLYPDELSGGQRRRTALARATIHQPQVLLMDEPFNALDEPLRRSLLCKYEQILRQNQLTAILVTHSVEEAIYLGDSIQVISGNPHQDYPGKITYSIEVPFQKPRSPELFRDASFISLKEQVLAKFLPSDDDLA